MKRGSAECAAAIESGPAPLARKPFEIQLECLHAFRIAAFCILPCICLAMHSAFALPSAMRDIEALASMSLEASFMMLLLGYPCL